MAVSYLDELFGASRQAEYYFLMLSLLAFTAAIGVGFVLSRSISRPIESLRRSMQAVESGNFDIDITVNATNEVYQLAQDCDIAVKKVRDLIEQNRREQELKRGLELRALQAQINPHFLYNTLDSIIWMIELGENTRAIDMTTSLARFFRLGVSRGSETISFRTEIEYLETYLAIQKQRYKDKLSYEIDFAAALRDRQILKLLIQPLVENAIYHGIKNKEGPGLVRITAAVEEQAVCCPRPRQRGRHGRRAAPGPECRPRRAQPDDRSRRQERAGEDPALLRPRLRGALRERAPGGNDGHHHHSPHCGADPVKNRTVLLLLTAAVLAALLLTFLYRGNRLFGPGPETPRTAIVIFKTIDYQSLPFWGNVRDGAISAGKDFNLAVSVRGTTQESDIEGQIVIVRQAMEEKPDAIVLAAADFNLLVPLVREIRRRGIPLVSIDSFVNADVANVRIGTDNYEGGQKCAVALMRYVRPGDTVAVMSYVKGSSTAIDRESGARDYLRGKVRILDTLYSGSDAATAHAQTARLIARHRGFAGSWR